MEIPAVAGCGGEVVEGSSGFCARRSCPLDIPGELGKAKADAESLWTGSSRGFPQSRSEGPALDPYLGFRTQG